MPAPGNISLADFDAYLRQPEPGLRERAGAWQAAIGLQAVDGLRTSDYLADTARRHIEGDITIDEVKQLVNTYYRSEEVRANYRHYQNNVTPDLLPLVNFLRCVLLGEVHDLHNRNLHVSVNYRSEDESFIKKSEQVELRSFSSQRFIDKEIARKNAQVQLKSFSLQAFAGESIKEKSEQVQQERRLRRLLRALGQQELTVPELMKLLRLTARHSFTKNWLAPALQQGLVRPLHPDSPHHPRQKYLLTDKGQQRHDEQQ